jgi:predicted amidohydrolase
MLYVVTLLVCMSGTPQSACTRDTAVDVIAGPENATLGYCSPLAQQYVARTTLLPPGRYLKVLCRPLEQRSNVG